MLKTLIGNENAKSDLIPADFAVNSFIVAAEYIANKNNRKCPVFNCTTSSEAPITWRELYDTAIKVYWIP